MAKKTAIINIRLLDGKSKNVQENMGLLISGNIIEQTGTSAEIASIPNTTIIDAQGKTAMPLLIDGHMHLTGEPGNLDHFGHLRSNLRAVGMLQQCLDWGTGLVGHAAGGIENVILRDVIAEGSIRGCAETMIGGAVTATAGHVAGFTADGPWEVRKAVRHLNGGGVDFIKTCASGGFQGIYLPSDRADYSAEELKAIVAEAHAKGIRVHVHAHAQPGLDNAIEAGCDVILHGSCIDEKALVRIKEKDLYFMPTLHITSDMVIGPNSCFPAYILERMRKAHITHRAGVRKAHEIGVKIVVGTDGGPGSVMNELNELVKCGLTPMEAICAASSKTAEALGVGERTGSLEAGKKADLMLVAGKLDQDISLMLRQDSIHLIMKKGCIVKNGL